MDELTALQPHLEHTVRAYLGANDGALQVDEHGCFPIRWGSALYQVGLIDHQPVLVRVESIVLEGVAPSDALFRTLNDINAAARSTRIYWRRNQIVAATEIPATSMDVADLRQACESVATLADWADTELQPRFGGARAFATESARELSPPPTPNPKRPSTQTAAAAATDAPVDV